MTWNADSCENIFRIIDKALTPQDYPFRTLHSAVLLVHTIVLYGSEVAVDRALQISRFVFSLQTYNRCAARRLVTSSVAATDSDTFATG